jgi:hypothetical protein
MHVSKDELDATVIGEYEGRSVDAGGIRIAFESMPAQFPPNESPFKGLPEVRLLELSPADEHDRAMATVARNTGLVAG